jgi:putative spermidine/putrescine transport system permease protein
MKKRTKVKISKYSLLLYFIGFAFFLYLPMLSLFVLSFQGPTGGTTFPMVGASFHWWRVLLQQSSIIDAFFRSIVLGVMVMLVTALFSTMLGMGFRKRFKGSGIVFYSVIAGLMTPGILISTGLVSLLRILGISANWYSTGLGVQVVWTLPFGFLLMLAVFNRFDKSIEEAASDLGASKWKVFKEVTLPIISVGVLGASLFGFTLSYDEFARTLMVCGMKNTLPLEIFARMSIGIHPVVFVMGTASTVFSLCIIGVFLYLSKKMADRVVAKEKNSQSELSS